MSEEFELLKEWEEVLPVSTSVNERFVGKKIVNISMRRDGGKKVSANTPYFRTGVDITFDNGEVITIAYECIMSFDCGPEVSMTRLHIGEHIHTL